MPAQDTTARVAYKLIPDFPGYRVGDDGSVWSCWARKSKGYRGLTARQIGSVWMMLKSKKNKGGRPYVSLFKSGRKHYVYIHRLVLEVFVGPCPNGMECCHFPDRDITNNNLSNLRWATHKENAGDAKRHKSFAHGERNGASKLTKELAAEIRRLSESGETRTSIAKRFGVSRTTILRVATGDSYK